MKLQSVLVLALIFFCAQIPAQSPAPKNPGKPAAKKPAKVEEEEEEEKEDEAGEGDPFMRYEKATNKDQICDPTILEQFYKKHGYLKCLATPSGQCFSPGYDQFEVALWGGAFGIGGGIGKEFGERKAARKELLRLMDDAAATAARETAEALDGKTAVQALKGAKPLLLSETEKAAAKSLGGIVVRGGGRGAIFGFLGGGAVGVTLLALDLSLSYGISPTGCAEAMENDPNFRKYVPLERGTCHTPIYNSGAPQVVDFLKLPLKDKIKVLDGNRRICGFYKSMNEEMDIRIAQLEGGRAIGAVTCDAATGDITYKIRNNATRTMIIKRKPGTKEPTAFQFRDFIAPNVSIDGANFELVKTEFGSELRNIEILNRGVSNMIKKMPYEEFPAWSREEPTRAQAVIYSFRTSRTHASALMKCCDMSPTELAKKETQETCPREWFPTPPVKTPLPPTRPKSTR